MLFLIDTQQDTLRSRMKTSSLILGQLLTPLTGYSDWGGVYAIDNGAFSGFPADKFQRLLQRQDSRKADCLFVTCPDIVGAGQRTIELFKRRSRWIPEGWKVAMVAQDGLEDLEIPWDDMDAVFIGGGDPWKDSKAAADIVKTAKILGKWVHVGRVNTPKRFEHFAQLGADSCDGSGVAMYDHMLEKIERRNDPVPTLFD
jgi:hypothetical protein